MRQVVVVVLASLAFAACGAPVGGGGGGGAGVTPTDTVGGVMDVAADSKAGEDAVAADGTADAAKADAAPDVPSDVVQPGSLKTCTAASQCAVDACKANWTATCGQTCANATATAAAPTAAALLDCTTKKCLNGTCAGAVTEKCMNDCTAASCGNELVACWEQGATPGSQGCSGILNCLTACDNDPERFTCQAKCYTAVNTAGEAQFKAMSACVNANGGKTDPCVKESLICLSDGKSGSGTCYDVQDCVGKCASTDTACQGACYGNGSTTAQTQLLALLSCVNTSGAAACLTPTITCATPTGSVGCLNTATCVSGCAAGATQAKCVMDCIHAATPAAATSFGKLAPCMQKNCANCTGSACQSCATSKCLTQALDCNSN